MDAYLSNFGGCCVADFSTMLKEALRVLRPGGRAAFSLRNEVSGIPVHATFRIRRSLGPAARFATQPDPQREQGSSDDSFYRLISETLQPHGCAPRDAGSGRRRRGRRDDRPSPPPCRRYPPFAEREGLWLGHDPAKLQQR